MKLKVKPVIKKTVTEVKEPVKKEVNTLSEEEKSKRLKILTTEIDRTRAELGKTREHLKSLLTDRFLLANYPYKDGDFVTVEFGTTQIRGKLVIIGNDVDRMIWFGLYPFKKDGELSSVHRLVYESNKILGYYEK